jgi:preprotein translocase subunit SecG
MASSSFLHSGVTAVHVFAALILMISVLLQTGKGSGLGAAFGGTSSSVFGARGPAGLIAKVTAVAAVIFMTTSFTLAMAARGGSGSSLLDEVGDSTAPASSSSPVAGSEPAASAQAAAPDAAATAEGASGVAPDAAAPAEGAPTAAAADAPEAEAPAEGAPADAAPAEGAGDGVAPPDGPAGEGASAGN